MAATGSAAPMAAAPTLPQSDKTRIEFLEATGKFRSKMWASLRDWIKSCFLGDPDMWAPVRNGINDGLDRLWADLEHEVEKNIQFSMLQQQANADKYGPSGRFPLNLWFKFRAFLLYHYLPHDKYFFGKLKDPVYLLIYVLTCIPIHGVRVAVFSVLFLCILLPSPPDEYQMINFILLFKGTQFFTSGLVAMGLGVWKYFACYTWSKDNLLECINERGPGAYEAVGQSMDYLGGIVLVWSAFKLLESSNRYIAPQSARVTLARARRDSKYTWTDDQMLQAGGRLRKLLVYDVKVFTIIFCIICLLTFFTCRENFTSFGAFRTLPSNPQFSANVSWCCITYSIMQLPFAPFMIPGWQTILTHSDATGYNRRGACVEFGLSAIEPTEEEQAAATENTSNLRYMAIASSVLAAMETGEYSAASAMRGLWNWGWSSRPAPAQPAAAAADAAAASSNSSGWFGWMWRSRARQQSDLTRGDTEHEVESDISMEANHTTGGWFSWLWGGNRDSVQLAPEEPGSPLLAPTLSGPLTPQRPAEPAGASYFSYAYWFGRSKAEQSEKKVNHLPVASVRIDHVDVRDNVREYCVQVFPSSELPMVSRMSTGGRSMRSGGSMYQDAIMSPMTSAVAAVKRDSSRDSRTERADTFLSIDGDEAAAKFQADASTPFLHDVELGEEPWQVYRTFNEFKELATQLGSHAASSRDAAVLFPTEEPGSDSDMDALSAWLQRAVEAAAKTASTHEDRIELLRKFLKVDDFEYYDDDMLPLHSQEPKEKEHGLLAQEQLPERHQEEQQQQQQQPQQQLQQQQQQEQEQQQQQQEQQQQHQQQQQQQQQQQRMEQLEGRLEQLQQQVQTPRPSVVVVQVPQQASQQSQSMETSIAAAVSQQLQPNQQFSQQEQQQRQQQQQQQQQQQHNQQQPQLQQKQPQQQQQQQQQQQAPSQRRRHVSWDLTVDDSSEEGQGLDAKQATEEGQFSDALQTTEEGHFSDAKSSTEDVSPLPDCSRNTRRRLSPHSHHVPLPLPLLEIIEGKEKEVSAIDTMTTDSTDTVDWVGRLNDISSDRPFTKTTRTASESSDASSTLQAKEKRKLNFKTRRSLAAPPELEETQRDSPWACCKRRSTPRSQSPSKQRKAGV